MIGLLYKDFLNAWMGFQLQIQHSVHPTLDLLFQDFSILKPGFCHFSTGVSFGCPSSLRGRHFLSSLLISIMSEELLQVKIESNIRLLFFENNTCKEGHF